jgi:tetratricopeptide (TPR) repeat protein
MISRRSWLFLFAVIAVAGLAGGIWWWQHGPRNQIEPPVIDFHGENEPELAKAVEEARTKVLRQPRSAEAWGGLGKLLFANGMGEDSLVCFGEAARLDPAEPRWPYLHGLAQQAINLEGAIPHFREAAHRAHTGAAANIVRLRYGEALARKGETAEATRVLHEVLRNNPDEVRALFMLGVLASDANDLDEAEADFLKCVSSPLTRQRATTRLAGIALQRGDEAAAKQYSKQAKSYPPFDPEGPDPYAEEYKSLLIGRRARLVRAEGMVRDGALQEAVELLEPLTQLDDAEPEAFVKLGMAYAQLGKYKEAEKVLRRGLAGGHDQVQAHFLLCVALFDQAEKSGARSGFEEASEQARQTIALKSDHAYAHLYLGLALNKLGKPEEGIKELEKAERISPESTDPHLHLGEALLAAGQKEKGIAQLEKAEEVAKDGDLRPRLALEKWRKRR